ncbi:MAG: hypothetical protein J6B87_07265 [Clostridia bacterium]|nr:hypothetical protein [Clostridia bacterium]
MVTIQNLYNNIKEFIHQKFEYKEEENTILPQTIESFFQYIQGALNISNSTQTVNIGPNDGDGEEIEGAIIIDSEITHTLLYKNLITLIHKYFYKTEEKPEKYYEWLTSGYVNGKWYIGEEAPSQTVINQSLPLEDRIEMYYVGHGPQYIMRIYNAIPESFNDNQTVSLKVENLFYDDDINEVFTVNSTMKNLGFSFVTRQYYMNSGAYIEVTLNPYIDETYNVYYTGFTFSITFSEDVEIAQTDGFAAELSNDRTTIYVD